MASDSSAALSALQDVLKREFLLFKDSLEITGDNSTRDSAIRTLLEQLLAFRKLYFLFHLIGIHLDEISNQKSLLESVVRPCRTLAPLFARPQPSVIEPFIPSLQKFSSDVWAFASACAAHLSANPSAVDQFTFSVIPGIFGYFWCQALEKPFLVFLESLRAENAEIASSVGRVLFALPEFRFFIEVVLSETSPTARDVVGGRAAPQEFLTAFSAAWRANVDFAPAILKKAVEPLGRKAAAAFIAEAFLGPVFSLPSVFGFLDAPHEFPAAAVAAFEKGAPAIAHDLADALRTAPSSSAFPAFAEVLQAFPEIAAGELVLSSSDLESLSSLIGLTCPSDFKNGKYQLFSICLPTAPAPRPLRRGAENELEAAIRALLIRIPSLPAAPASDLIVLLRDQIPLCANRERALIAAMIEDLGRALSVQKHHWTMTELVGLLERHFVQRQPERRAALETITLTREIERQLVWPIDHLLTGRIWQASWPIQASVLAQFVAAEGSVSTEGLFVDRFALFVTRAWEWAARSGYTFEIDFFIWVDFATRFWTQSQFREEHPKLVDAGLRLKDLPKDEFNEKWAPKIAGDLGAMAAEFRTAVIEESPGLGSRLFGKAMARWERLMVSILNEVGADEMMPLLMMIRDTAECPGFLVAVAYWVDTVKATLDWAVGTTPPGVSLAGVSAIPGFGHKLASLVSAAEEQVEKLKETLKIEVDFEFMQ
jgi:hypothetical protein